MIIKKKYKEKVFNDNESYLEFINKMKDKINVIKLKPYRNGWKLEFEEKL